MPKKFNIHKAAGIIIRDKKLLVERSTNKDFFISPGGSIEEGETAKEALVRELMEEFQIDVKKEDLEEFGTFYADAAGRPGEALRMDVFVVSDYNGEPTPNNEVEEIDWITSNFGDKSVGSIFAKDVIPMLKGQGLIS